MLDTGFPQADAENASPGAGRRQSLAARATRLRGHPGARIWCGHGVFAHNLVKLTEMKR